jgi:hypothetical protein
MRQEPFEGTAKVLSGGLAIQWTVTRLKKVNLRMSTLHSESQFFGKWRLY